MTACRRLVLEACCDARTVPVTGARIKAVALHPHATRTTAAEMYSLMFVLRALTKHTRFFGNRLSATAVWQVVVHKHSKDYTNDTT
jgi:hypothetical protein